MPFLAIFNNFILSTLYETHKKHFDPGSPEFRDLLPVKKLFYPLPVNTVVKKVLEIKKALAPFSDFPENNNEIEN